MLRALLTITGCAQMDWDKASKTNTLAGYKDFIAKYPDRDSLK